jgi:hypothetical protein
MVIGASLLIGKNNKKEHKITEPVMALMELLRNDLISMNMLSTVISCEKASRS